MYDVFTVHEAKTLYDLVCKFDGDVCLHLIYFLPVCLRCVLRSAVTGSFPYAQILSTLFLSYVRANSLPTKGLQKFDDIGAFQRFEHTNLSLDRALDFRVFICLFEFLNGD